GERLVHERGGPRKSRCPDATPGPTASSASLLSHHGSWRGCRSRVSPFDVIRHKDGCELNRMALLNVTEVSEWLKVKRSTTYLWAEQGMIPHLKLGRLLR